MFCGLRYGLAVIVLSGLAACAPAPLLPTQAALPTMETHPTLTVASTGVEIASPQPRSTNTLTATQPPSITPEPSPTPSMIPTATITETPTITPTPLPLDIDFERVYPIALHLRAPLIKALTNERAALTTHRYTLTSYKESNGWIKILLVPTVLIEANWQHVEEASTQFVEILGWQEGGVWYMARLGSPAFGAIRDRIPETFIAQEPMPPLAGAYLLPWARGQAWWAIQGWHDGNALDFQPVTGQRPHVVAAESGWLREICGDGYQSFLELQHADGRSTFYLHVTLPRRVRALLDHPIQRGQPLGELIGEANFATDCGHGLSRHLHFVSSDRTLTIDGNRLDEIADIASCCARPPVFVSSNTKVDEMP